MQILPLKYANILTFVLTKDSGHPTSLPVVKSIENKQ